MFIYFEDTISKLLKSFYVYNCVSSMVENFELLKLIREATNIMVEGKFEWPSLISETGVIVTHVL